MLTDLVRSCVICDSAAARRDRRTCDNPVFQQPYRLHLEQRLPTCMACGRPLSARMQTGRPNSCGRPQCNAKITSAPTGAAICSVCGVVLPNGLRKQCCESADCAMIHARWRLQAVAEQKQLQVQQQVAVAQRLRDDRARERAIESPEDYLVTLVPHTSAELDTQPAERLQAFQEHIETIMTAAVTRRPADNDMPYHPEDFQPDATEQEAPLFGTACRLCQGHCCRQGGTHAFLTIGTMRGKLAEHPERSPVAIVNEYLSFLPTRAVKGSCVYHGQRGCTLPREMRAIMCNRYICRDIKRMRQNLVENPSQTFFIAATDDDHAVCNAEFYPPTETTL